MHPKVKLYVNWGKELKLEFKIWDKKFADRNEITDEIEEFQKKVDVQTENVAFIANSPDSDSYGPLLQKGIKLMKEGSSLSKNMTIYYNRLNEMQKIFIKMTNDITAESKNLDPAHPNVLIKKNRAILKEAKGLMKPIEEDLDNMIDDLLDERDQLEDTLNSMIE